MSGEPFRIRWAGPARRALQTHPEKVATATVELIHGALADNPRRVGTPLARGLEGIHSARRGTYRVLYRVLNEEHAVEVLAIKHRADVYRRR